MLVAGCTPAADDYDRREQTITNGTLDTGDDGVVGLVGGGQIYCSGTVIAPRVVVTAAHCLVSTTVSAAAVGPDLASAQMIAAVHARVHPDFDSLLLTADIGLVLLADVAPTAPLPRLDTPLDASFIGGGVRLVGFGQTSATDTSVARKREGIGTLASFTAADFDVSGNPSLTCGGDSGGAAFVTVGATEYLAGIVSAGDADCSLFSRSIRADVHRTYIDDFVAATDVGAAQLGDRCYYPTHCTTGTCVFPDDAPRIGYCTTACTDDAECAAGMECTADQCRYPQPSPGALGAPCTAYYDCDSLLCAHTSTGAGSCSIVCDPGFAPCPGGFDCLPDAVEPTLNACFPEPTSDDGCSASSRPTAGAFLLVLLVVVRLRIAKRRSIVHG